MLYLLFGMSAERALEQTASLSCSVGWDSQSYPTVAMKAVSE